MKRHKLKEEFTFHVLHPYLINRLFVWKLLLATEAAPYESPGWTGWRNWTWGLFDLDLSGFLSYDHLASTSFSQTEMLGLLHKRTTLKFSLFNFVLNLEIYFDRLKSFWWTNTSADSGQHGNEILTILITVLKFNTNSVILDHFNNVQKRPHNTSGFCATLIKIKIVFFQSCNRKICCYEPGSLTSYSTT